MLRSRFICVGLAIVLGLSASVATAGPSTTAGLGEDSRQPVIVLAQARQAATHAVTIRGCCVLHLPNGWSVYEAATKSTPSPAEAARKNLAPPVAVSFKNSQGKLIMNIATAPVKPVPTATQAAVRRLDAAGLRQVDANQRTAIENDVSVLVFGQKILAYQPTQRVEVNGASLLWTTYRVQHRSGSVDQVQRYRYLEGPKSFDLTFTYEDSASDAMISVIRQIEIKP